jgi:hypothetical protein
VLYDLGTTFALLVLHGRQPRLDGMSALGGGCLRGQSSFAYCVRQAGHIAGEQNRMRLDQLGRYIIRKSGDVEPQDSIAPLVMSAGVHAAACGGAHISDLAAPADAWLTQLVVA